MNDRDNLYQEAFQMWKDYLFLDEITAFSELSLLQREFLLSLSLKYKGEWKVEILNRVAQEFFEFYEEDEQAEGIKIQSLDLSKLEAGSWQMLFEDESEDHLVHVYFKGWDRLFSLISIFFQPT